MLFVFGETVQSLQRAFMEFCSARSIPYCITDIYAPIDSEEAYGRQQWDADPLAIVLCKVANAEPICDSVRDGKHRNTEDRDCCQVSWSELQGFDDMLKRGHGG